jgi:RNA polymerase sigma-70 factor (ECF subfamily)
LLSRVRDGSNDAAWAEFESRYRDLILRYAMARGMQHADAEDICQIVMMSLAKALRGFQYSSARGRFRDYLGRVVRNAVARFRTRPNPVPVSLDTGMDLADGAEVGSQADSLWEQEWVDHHYRLALRTVRATFDRQSVEIFEQLIGGRSVAAVAAGFGTTEQAVHKIKQRIRGRMEELVAAQVQEEDEPDAPRVP